jgi:hypothetical protein
MPVKPESFAAAVVEMQSETCRVRRCDGLLLDRDHELERRINRRCGTQPRDRRQREYERYH